MKISKVLNTFICGDCIKVMKKLPDNSIDIAVTSPPYNLKNSTGNGLKSSDKLPGLVEGYDNYEDNMPYDEYIEWQRNCLFEMMRLIKDDGAIFYNHKWRVQNGILQDRREIIDGFPLRQIIIWQRPGGINFNDTYFLPSYEVIYVIAKPKFSLVKKACRHTDVWKIPFETNNKHPAPFPVKLPYRIISSTNANIVLDPFMGSGSTAIACLQLGKNYIGIEQSKKYIKMSNDRVNSYKKMYGKGLFI